MSECTAEAQLLLNCTKSAINSDSSPNISTFIANNSIDWSNFTRLAQKNRVIPLVYRSLQNAAIDIPSEIEEIFTSYVGKRTRQSLLLARELVRVLQILERVEITAIPFKGAALALLAYGKLTDRDFSDLDILLCRSDIPKAVEILCANGYRDRYEFTPAQQAERWERHHEWDLIKENGLVALDLHWGFTERIVYFPLDIEALEPRLSSLNLFGQKLPSFSVTDTLLILCVNGCKEFWYRLLRICDIAALISRHPQIEWEQLLTTATQLGSRRMVLLGLILAQDLMGIVLPEVILDSIKRDKAAQLLAEEVKQRLLTDNSLDKVEMYRYHIRMRERTSDRLWYIYHYFKYSGGLTPSYRDRQWIALPEGLSFLYYAIRPLRVFGKYGTKIVKRSPN